MVQQQIQIGLCQVVEAARAYDRALREALESPRVLPEYMADELLHDVVGEMFITGNSLSFAIADELEKFSLGVWSAWHFGTSLGCVLGFDHLEVENALSGVVPCITEAERSSIACEYEAAYRLKAEQKLSEQSAKLRASQERAEAEALYINEVFNATVNGRVVSIYEPALQNESAFLVIRRKKTGECLASEVMPKSRPCFKKWEALNDKDRAVAIAKYFGVLNGTTPASFY